jgi:hypothetical protein
MYVKQVSYLAFSASSYLPFSVNVMGRALRLRGGVDFRRIDGISTPP